VADPVPALRVLHLFGGLRVVDVGEPLVEVNITPETVLGRFDRPDYPLLYDALERRNLRPIGVEFYRGQETINGIQPPDWRSFEPRAGFLAAEEREAWAQARHSNKQIREEADDIGGRFATYFDLMEFRVREMSEAYNRCLRSICNGMSRDEMVRDDRIFDNG
jgi:hypothetical protein